MIRIAICDSENIYAHKLEQAINHFMKENNSPCEISVYRSGKELLGEGIRIFHYDVVFLDIDEDGMTIAKEMQNFGENLFVVFFSLSADHILDGYKYDVIRYILKDDPDFQSTVGECMAAIIKKMQMRRTTFQFREGIRMLLLERLIYIESRLHTLEFHVMEDGEKVYTMNKKMDDLDSELRGCGFIRLHQSFLVNIKYIKAVKRYKAILINNQEIVIPKTRYLGVKNEFDKYSE